MEALVPYYMAFKHSHLLLLVISISLFVVRFVLLQRQSSWLEKKPLKIAPHVIDTFLLLTGVCLALMLEQYPGQSPWLTEKLLAVVAYIFLAAITLKVKNKRAMQYFTFFGALGWVVYAAKLAHFKQAVFIS